VGNLASEGLRSCNIFVLNSGVDLPSVGFYLEFSFVRLVCKSVGRHERSKSGAWQEIYVIIIFIQLQLGWNPVAEVYNTYTATV
jgi:hypothetical protein